MQSVSVCNALGESLFVCVVLCCLMRPGLSKDIWCHLI